MGGKRALLGTPRPFPQRSDTSAEHFIQTPAAADRIRNDKKNATPRFRKDSEKENSMHEESARISKRKH